MAAACPFPGVQGSQVLIQELITGLAARGTGSTWSLIRSVRTPNGAARMDAGFTG